MNETRKIFKVYEIFKTRIVSLLLGYFRFPIKNVDLPLTKKTLIFIGFVGLLKFWFRTHQLFLKRILIFTVFIMNNTLIKIFNTLYINLRPFKLRIFMFCRVIKIANNYTVFMALLRKATRRFTLKFRLFLYVFVSHAAIVDSFWGTLATLLKVFYDFSTNLVSYLVYVIF